MQEEQPANTMDPSPFPARWSSIEGAINQFRIRILQCRSNTEVPAPKAYFPADDITADPQ